MSILKQYAFMLVACGRALITSTPPAQMQATAAAGWQWLEQRRWAYRLTARMGLTRSSRESAEIVRLLLGVAARFPHLPDRTVSGREKVLLSAIDVAHSERARTALQERLGVVPAEAQMLQSRLWMAYESIARELRSE
ncbi:hypothetical protein [Salinarimonas soli]|uniref:Uncharacterized protein n=1 Tax=Salinarimonas soli TaxID=1638099 RepID=A0A5B2VCS2_9HYPH|nr:hypothetical protein [Salinarimonas soli]KAA2235937.1 hypothetical protein F0L46_17385 [Salinarimonas soli]